MHPDDLAYYRLLRADRLFDRSEADSGDDPDEDEGEEPRAARWDRALPNTLSYPFQRNLFILMI